VEFRRYNHPTKEGEKPENLTVFRDFPLVTVEFNKTYRKD